MIDWCPENDGAYRAELAHKAKVMRDRDALSSAMKIPEVKALVDALERIAHAADIYSVEANAEDQGADTLAYAHKSTCNLARAALAQIKEPANDGD